MKRRKICIKILKMRRKHNLYILSSWIIIAIGAFMFFYFMRNTMPRGNEQYVIPIGTAFAGITLLAGYKVIGKDEALDEIKELKAEIEEWKERYDECDLKYNTLQNEVTELRKMIFEHLNKK